MRTIDDTLPNTERTAARSGRRVACLYLVINARDLSSPPSRHVLDCDVVAIGRGSAASVSRETNDGKRELSVVLPDRWMSKLPHAQLHIGLSRCTMQDADSRNGVEVDGVRVATHLLQDGAMISVGKAVFLFRENVRYDDKAPLDRGVSFAASPVLLTLNDELHTDLQRVCAVASARTPILIQAPTGCGKELLAREIHTQSGREGPLVPVNCGAIATNLVEAELFGHRKGAFSGATEDRVGLVGAAHKGTLFLDEIADLPLSAQAALLRVLQEHEVRRVGGTSAEKVDLRVVAATHHDLEALVKAGTFREDLYARIAGVTTRLPALVERREDFGILVTTLLHSMKALDGFAGFEVGAIQAMLAYEWPRNIRELEHALSSALSLAGGEIITIEHLPEPVQAAIALRDTSSDEALRLQLTGLLQQHSGNVTKVAADMGKKRQQIQRWCRRLDLDPASFRG